LTATFEDLEAANVTFKVYKQIKARDLSTRSSHQAHHNGEPGLLFIDAANRRTRCRISTRWKPPTPAVNSGWAR